jgi:hypothetical protein
LRDREGTFIEAQAAIPELLIRQINQIRSTIETIENELFTTQEETPEAIARQFYWEAFQSELAGDLSKATKLYRSAGRYAHSDANAALRHVRYLMRSAQKDDAAVVKTWAPTSAGRLSRGYLLALLVALMIIVILIVLLGGRSPAEPQQAIAIEITPMATATPPLVKLIIPATATPIPSATAIPTPSPTNIPLPSPSPTRLIETPTPTPTIMLLPAPKMIGPRDGLVWNDGAIVFEFEPLDLADDELYCLNTLRGYDITNTENWSFPPAGNTESFIPIQAHVFRIAKVQDVRCVVWSAAIGKGSCENIISESTAERSIGLPTPCEFIK